MLPLQANPHRKTKKPEIVRSETLDLAENGLAAIDWNREHKRGFLKWNLGWTSGTHRLVREGYSWKLETISSWIT